MKNNLPLKSPVNEFFSTPVSVLLKIQWYHELQKESTSSANSLTLDDKLTDKSLIHK